jgi:Fe-S-cluster-containing dehydrogenase component/formate-dependent nitrite reductase membrane component NrfD
MEYGFVIDNQRCIGCHACTVACKAEHEVPLGSFRTWVKNVEKGSFPDVRRHFTVLRCNHCADAPCVNICPTRALFHRRDAIVDFNSAHCIGCKACMAACPYDAIYIDPDTGSAAKCNYCAHRIEIKMEPPCVTVCPEQAIIAGDLSDSRSRISSLLALRQVSVRKPEKGTRPRVYYIGADDVSLAPETAAQSGSYAWAERPATEAAPFVSRLPGDAPARVSYDISHERPWGLGVSLYLWTKSLAAGPILTAALLMLLHYMRAPILLGMYAPSLALAMTVATVLLLIGDLERPGRFLKIVFHPNPRSWLVWGSYSLTAFFVVAFLWLAAGAAGLEGILTRLLWPGLLLAALAAGYSAFLLAQARGRDLWQSRLLFPHLIVQAFLAGSAALALGAAYLGSGRMIADFLLRCLLGGLCVHGIFILSEIGIPHGSEAGNGAVRYMLQGPLSQLFWIGAVFIGFVAPVNMLALYFAGAISDLQLGVPAAVLSLLGLLAYEHCYIRAGQALALS